jgi:uncharacterized protein YndB with AHSA1/START domain
MKTMTANKELKVKADGKTLTLSRQFDAPRDLVFDAFSDCEHLAQWWGPRGWELTHCEIDFRPGGQWHYCMNSEADDMESWGLEEYEEIERPATIKYVDYFSDEQGNKNMDMPAAPTVVTFTESDGVTTLESITEYATEKDLQQVLEMGVEEGVRQTWERLDEALVDWVTRAA